MKTTGESAKSAKVKKDDPEQSRRFVETAKELEADKSDKAFHRAINAITPRVFEEDVQPKKSK